MSTTDAIGRLGPLTHDAFLGGRVHLRQPKRGHRAGFESVLLGASVDGAAGERLIDLGAGVGAAGLSAAVRVSGLVVSLVEREAGLSALSAQNADAVGCSYVCHCVDATEPPARLAEHGLLPDRADHVICNPPFRSVGHGTRSPDGMKARAHSEPGDLLRHWLKTALMLARHGGTIAFVLPPELLSTVLSWAEGRMGAIRVLPIAHRPGLDAVRVIVKGVRSRRSPLVLRPFLCLTDEDGAETGAARAVLREGRVLDF